jgi:hypothetical protein
LQNYVVFNKRAVMIGSSDRLFMTADCDSSRLELLHPWRQIEFMDALCDSMHASDCIAQSLVYSTPRGNTGWTAFRFGRSWHAAFHHWDRAKPSLLQLDVQVEGGVDSEAVSEVVRDFWNPTGLLVASNSSVQGSFGFVAEARFGSLVHRENAALGLGPGHHRHLVANFLLVDWRIGLVRAEIDKSLVALVDMLGMVCMTPAMSAVTNGSCGQSYDGVIGITTSHILLRIRVTEGDLHIDLDVFSCKDFESRVVMEWVRQAFGNPVEASGTLLDRYPAHEIGEINWNG